MSRRDKKRQVPEVQRRYVPLEEAAAFYGCSTRTIRRRIADGDLEAVRIGNSRTLRVSIESLEALGRPVGAA